MVTYSLVDIPDITPGDDSGIQWGGYYRMDRLSKANFTKRVRHRLRVIVYNRNKRRRPAREKQTALENRDQMIRRRLRGRPCRCPDRLTY